MATTHSWPLGLMARFFSLILWILPPGYEERFERSYEFFRPYLRKVIYHYLDCGNLNNGFALMKHKDCGHEYLLAFTFMRYCFQTVIIDF
jgi:hypothetical protein